MHATVTSYYMYSSQKKKYEIITAAATKWAISFTSYHDNKSCISCYPLCLIASLHSPLALFVSSFFSLNSCTHLSKPELATVAKACCYATGGRFDSQPQLGMFCFFIKQAE